MLHCLLGKSRGGISGRGESEVRERETLPTGEHVQTASLFLSRDCMSSPCLPFPHPSPLFHLLPAPLAIFLLAALK